MKHKFNPIQLLVMSMSFLVFFVCLFVGFDSPEGVMTAMTAPLIAATSQRAAFERFKRFLIKTGEISDLDGGIFTQTDLRLECVLDPTKSTASLDVSASTGSGDRPLEDKLSTGEIFWIHGVAICVQKQETSATGVLGLNQANNPLFTYPDYNYFADPSEAAALETIYQGQLSLTTGGTQRIRGMKTHHMRYVPNHQFEPAVVTGQANPEFPGYGGFMEERGYYDFDPNHALYGDQTNRFELTFGAGDRTAIKGTTNVVSGTPSDNVLVMLVKGWTFVRGSANGVCLAV